MKFLETAVAGAFLLEPERHEDERGSFARTWARDQLLARGLEASLDYAASSWNRRKHTLRGMHYQVAPFEEAKLVSCMRGAIHDVIVDLRPQSPSFRGTFAAQLDAAAQQSLYIPAGVAHGFLTLEDDALVHYLVSGRWSPEHARGVRWNDPALCLGWPARPEVISARDDAWPDFQSP